MSVKKLVPVQARALTACGYYLGCDHLVFFLGSLSFRVRAFCLSLSPLSDCFCLLVLCLLLLRCADVLSSSVSLQVDFCEGLMSVVQVSNLLYCSVVVVNVVVIVIILLLFCCFVVLLFVVVVLLLLLFVVVCCVLFVCLFV
jgi:hypothetical protein